MGGQLITRRTFGSSPPPFSMSTAAALLEWFRAHPAAGDGTVDSITPAVTAEVRGADAVCACAVPASHERAGGMRPTPQFAHTAAILAAAFERLDLLTALIDTRGVSAVGAAPCAVCLRCNPIGLPHRSPAGHPCASSTTVLHGAALGGNTDVIRALLSRGASARKTDSVREPGGCIQTVCLAPPSRCRPAAPPTCSASTRVRIVCARGGAGGAHGAHGGEPGGARGRDGVPRSGGVRVCGSVRPGAACVIYYFSFVAVRAFIAGPVACAPVGVGHRRAAPA